MTQSKEAVKRNFSRASGEYGRFAIAQQTIGARLVDALIKTNSGINPCSVLDVGCGTGFISRLIMDRFPGALITGLDISPGMIGLCRELFKGTRRFNALCGDGENCAFPRIYDMVVSNYCLQWFLRKKEGIENMIGSLVLGGRLALSVPVKGSFFELFHCLTGMGAVRTSPVNLLFADDWMELFDRHDFRITHAEERRDLILYDTPRHVLKSFHKIGAGMRGQPDYKPLGVGQFRKLLDMYKNDFSTENGKCPVTYKSLILVGEKKS